MPSKGVQVYSYIAVQGARVEFYVPKGGVKHDGFREWTSDHLEVDKSNLSWIETVGRFGFHVFFNNQELTHQWVDISTLSGNLGDGTMNKIEQMRSIFAGGLVITYGFYDAGSGKFGLPNRDQCYVTVTKDQSGWMQDLAPEGSPAAGKPATSFALPCPHDCGMNTMETTDAVLNSPSEPLFASLLKAAVGNLVGGLVGSIAGSAYVREVVYALSVTQKDSISDMLRIGARYFEFRPAKLPAVMAAGAHLPTDKYYFIHSVIPGMSLDTFLDLALAFLETNKGEIVVVQMRRDGINNQFGIFDDASIDKVVNDNISRRRSSVQAATENELNTLSISQLRAANKRLVITKEHGGNQYSSWSESAYATLTPGPLINQFNSMSRNNQGGATFTELQCQATATSIPSVVTYSITASNAATSVLMCTKASCDMVTLPWIRDNAASKFDPRKSLIVMNDWIDGATCDVAIEASRKRLGM